MQNSDKRNNGLFERIEEALESWADLFGRRTLLNPQEPVAQVSSSATSPERVWCFPLLSTRRKGDTSAERSLQSICLRSAFRCLL